MNGPEEGAQSRGFGPWGLSDTLVTALNESTAERDQLRDLLRYEHERANAAIAREEALEEVLREADDDYLALASHTDATCSVVQERNRYRLAWLSARRRAAKESEYAAEALALKDRELSAARALAALDADGV